MKYLCIGECCIHVLLSVVYMYCWVSYTCIVECCIHVLLSVVYMYWWVLYTCIIECCIHVVVSVVYMYWWVLYTCVGECCIHVLLSVVYMYWWVLYTHIYLKYRIKPNIRRVLVSEIAAERRRSRRIMESLTAFASNPSETCSCPVNSV